MLFEQEEQITKDTPCVTCNYNLRGLRLSGYCPECNTPVGKSRHGLTLQYADARWLKRICLGLKLLLWGFALLVAAFAMILAALLSASSVPSRWWQPATAFSAGWPVVTAFVILNLFCVYWVVAFILLTTQEPRLRFEESAYSCRRLLRFSSVLLTPIAGLSLSNFSFLASSAWAGLVSDVSGTVVICLLGLYLRGFAPRTGDRILRARTTASTLGFTCCSLLLVCIPTLARVRNWNYSDPPSVLSFAYMIVGAFSLVYFIRYVSMLIRYKREFAVALSFVKEKKGERSP